MLAVRRTLLFFCLAISPFLLAQTDTARITGTVTDATGAAVQGAEVAVTSQATAQVVTAKTDGNGLYTVSALKPGAYHIEVKQANFKTVTADVTLEVSQVQQANFKLSPGSVDTEINVSGAVPLVETTTSSTGEVIQGRQVTELPLNGRNFTQLTLLTPGVTRGYYGDVSMGGSSGTNAEAFRYSDTGGASISANGLRQQANNYLLDGVDNNEGLVNSIVFFPPADAIQEFRVNTSVAPAEFGRAGGAIIQTTIKSGTNQIHGSAFDFRRTGAGSANPFGDKTAPPFKQNQFGGSIGFPIWKNKLFLFTDYQGLRQNTPIGIEYATVPTALMRQGNFSELLGSSLPTVPTATICPNLYAGGNVLPQYAGKGYIYNPTTCQPFGWNGTTGTNIIPTGMLNPAAVNYLNAFPTPTYTNKIEQNFQANRQSIRNYDDFDARLDFLATQKDSLFARFSYGQDGFTVTDRLKDASHDLPSGFGSGDNFNHPRGVAFGEVHSFSPNVINEFRFGFTRPAFGYEPPFEGVPLAQQLGIVNANRNPLLGGIALIGGYNNELEYTGDYGPYVVPQYTYQYSDTVSWNKGAHSFKFGASIIHRQVDFFQGNAAKGQFFIGPGTGDTTGYEVSELLAGFVDSYTIGPAQTTYDTNNWETGYFAQDDWRVTPRLTLNLGLRYDLYTWPTTANNQMSNFDPASGKLIVAGTAGWPTSLINTDKNNFAPRIGFAYDLTGDGRMVLRGGYGIFYYMDRGGVGEQLNNNPDFNGTFNYSYANGYRITFTGQAPMGTNDPTAATAALPLPAPGTGVDVNNPTGVNVIEYPRNSQNSSVQQWNLQLERQIGNNNAFDIAYVGTKMDHLATAYNANAAQIDTANTHAFPNLNNVNVYGMIGSGNYNGLQTRFDHRLSNGLQFTAAYTWSHTLDNSNSAFSPSNGGNGNTSMWIGPGGVPLLNLNYGNSDNDIRHFANLSMLYELPFGRGKQFGAGMSRLEDAIFGGWQWNNIVTLSSGAPINVTAGTAAGITGPGTVRTADMVGSAVVNPSHYVYFNAANFASPAANVPGNIARNYFHGPGLHTWDTSLFKDVHVTERVITQFRAELYNVTNSVQWQNPVGDFTNAGAFGLLQNARISSQREMQLVLRVTF